MITLVLSVAITALAVHAAPTKNDLPRLEVVSPISVEDHIPVRTYMCGYSQATHQTHKHI